jgi:hypothetical protein
MRAGFTDQGQPTIESEAILVWPLARLAMSFNRERLKPPTRTHAERTSAHSGRAEKFVQHFLIRGLKCYFF